MNKKHVPFVLSNSKNPIMSYQNANTKYVRFVLQIMSNTINIPGIAVFCVENEYVEQMTNYNPQTEFKYIRCKCVFFYSIQCWYAFIFGIVGIKLI